MYELNTFLKAADIDIDNNDWGQFTTLETPPQPQQFKARVKPVLPSIQEEEKKATWATFIARNLADTTLEKILDWLS